MIIDGSKKYTTQKNISVASVQPLKNTLFARRLVFSSVYLYAFRCFFSIYKLTEINIISENKANRDQKVSKKSSGFSKRPKASDKRIVLNWRDADLNVSTSAKKLK